MAGEKNLDQLLASLSPRLNEGEFVFCTAKDAKYGDFKDLNPVATYREDQGLTLVLGKKMPTKRNSSTDPHSSASLWTSIPALRR